MPIGFPDPFFSNHVYLKKEKERNRWRNRGDSVQNKSPLHEYLSTLPSQFTGIHETATQQCIKWVSEADSSWILGNFTNKTETLIYPLLLLLFYFMWSCPFPINAFPGNCFYPLRIIFCGGPRPDPYFLWFWFHSGIFGDAAGLQSGPNSISFINFSYQLSVTWMPHWAAGNCTAGLIQDRTGRPRSE